MVAEKMKIISAILNTPWSLVLLLFAVLSVPVHISVQSWAIIIKVKNFWWYYWLPGMSGVRAMTMGNVILLGSGILDRDLEHEMVHIEQGQKLPLIHPILNLIETLRAGLKDNKYEKEAYTRAGNKFLEH
jgi:hypothetical protein